MARRDEIRSRMVAARKAALDLQAHVKADYFKHQLELAVMHFADVESMFLGDVSERSLVAEAQWLDAAERFLQHGRRTYEQVRAAVDKFGLNALVIE